MEETAMAYVLVRHTVADFAKWKPLFDQHGEVRKTYGFKGGSLLRNANNPNELVILFEVESPDQARAFIQSENLRETMQQAGVIDQPTVFLLEKIEDFAH
jgi:heme-degrading monooxygenase HmoA